MPPCGTDFLRIARRPLVIPPDERPSLFLKSAPCGGMGARWRGRRAWRELGHPRAAMLRISRFCCTPGEVGARRGGRAAAWGAPRGGARGEGHAIKSGPHQSLVRPTDKWENYALALAAADSVRGADEFHTFSFGFAMHLACDICERINQSATIGAIRDSRYAQAMLFSRAGRIGASANDHRRGVRLTRDTDQVANSR